MESQMGDAKPLINEQSSSIPQDILNFLKKNGFEKTERFSTPSTPSEEGAGFGPYSSPNSICYKKSFPSENVIVRFEFDFSKTPPVIIGINEKHDDKNNTLVSSNDLKVKLDYIIWFLEKYNHYYTY